MRLISWRGLGKEEEGHVMREVIRMNFYLKLNIVRIDCE